MFEYTQLRVAQSTTFINPKVDWVYNGWIIQGEVIVAFARQGTNDFELALPKSLLYTLSID